MIEKVFRNYTTKIGILIGFGGQFGEERLHMTKPKVELKVERKNTMVSFSTELSK